MLSSACLTKCETSPGLAPCVSTAVGACLARVAQRQRLLAQRVVGAPRRREGRVGVAARPGLDAGVEVERALLPAELDQRDRRDVDRQVEQEVAAADQRVEHVAEVLARQRVLDEADAVFRRDLGAGIVGGDDRDLVGLDADVPQDQRQHALADAAEADDDQAAGERDVNGVAGHDCFIVDSWAGAVRMRTAELSLPRIGAGPEWGRRQGVQPRAAPSRQCGG